MSILLLSSKVKEILQFGFFPRTVIERESIPIGTLVVMVTDQALRPVAIAVERYTPTSRIPVHNQVALADDALSSGKQDLTLTSLLMVEMGFAAC